MSLSIQQLYIDKAARVNANLSSTEFARSFLNALNETLAEITNRGLITISPVNSVDASISNLDYRYIPTISVGVDYHLHQRSEWMIKQDDGGRSLEARWMRLLAGVNKIYYKDNPPLGRSGDYALADATEDEDE